MFTLNLLLHFGSKVRNLFHEVLHRKNLADTVSTVLISDLVIKKLLVTRMAFYPNFWVMTSGPSVSTELRQFRAKNFSGSRVYTEVITQIT